MFDIDTKSMRKEILEKTNRSKVGLLLEKEEAIEEIRNILAEEDKKALGNNENKDGSSIVVKDKKYLRERIEKRREQVTEAINLKNIKVKGVDTKEAMADFITEVVAETINYSVLYDAFMNPGVTDIYVVSYDRIFIEENGENKKYPKKFRSEKHLEDIIRNLVTEAGKVIDGGEHKKVDFELYGDRYCATHPNVSPNGYSLTIRKHSDDHITFEQLMKQNLMSEEMAYLTGLAIKGERNIIYAGITGSGKTTSIRAFLDHFVPKLNKRMLVCEDTQELFPKNDHTLELVSTVTGNPKNDITLQQLVYTSLRLKPKYIVIGEVRAEEAQAASEAMETGHSTILTMHGGRAINCINRFVTKFLTAMPNLGIEVVERIVGSSIDYIYIQDNVPGIGRRVTEISEISYDFEKRCVDVKPIYKFDIKTRKFVRLNDISEEKIEMMLRRGVTSEEIDKWLKGEDKDD